MTLGPVPKNAFKAALQKGELQLGLWCTLSTAYAVEVVADAGFDWLLLDTEHSPGDVLTVLGQLQALSGHQVSPVVRPATNDAVLIKRFLDIGAQTLLIPYVQSVDEARAAVAACRYPPEGMRGYSSLTRATNFGRTKDYATRAAGEICLLVQVETGLALERLEEIATVDGVDGVFIGPADLAASLGYVGQPDHPVVREAIEDAIGRLHACGKPIGLLTSHPEFVQRCIELRVSF